MNKISKLLKFSLINACYSFTTVMCVNILLGFAKNKSSLSLSSLLCLMLICLACGVLQVIFFSNLLIQKSSYILRVLLFGLALFAVISLLAITFGLLPAHHVGAWLRLLCSFLIVLAGVSAVFYLTSRARGRKYDALLEKYHEEHRA